MTAFRLAVVCLMAWDMAAVTAEAHPSAEMHYADIRMVLDGFCGENFNLLMGETSKAMDSMAYVMGYELRATKSFTADTHRIVGHSWPFDGPIPDRVLKLLEVEYGIQRARAGAWWAAYRERAVRKVMTLSGLPERQAVALAGVVWSTHHLGDRGFGNAAKTLWQVLESDEILKNLERHLKVLFKSHPDIAGEIMQRLRATLAKARGLGLGEAQTAELLMDELMKSRIGSKLVSVWGNRLSLEWTEAAARRCEGRLAARLAGRTVGKAAVGKAVGEASLVDSAETGVRMVRRHVGDCKVRKASDLPTGREMATGVAYEVESRGGAKGLAVLVDAKALRAGFGEGLVAFVFSEGVATYTYLKGGITGDEFTQETLKGFASSVAVGGAVYVAVALGASAGGPVVQAIAIAGYALCDLVFDQLRPSPFGPEDILGILPQDVRDAAGFLNARIPASFLDAREDRSFVSPPEKESVLHHRETQSVLSPLGRP